VRGRGFTLVEVMVALAVVAVALPALLVSLNQQVDSTGYLRDKSMAHMVAANKLEEVRIMARARESLLQGRDSGTERMADRDWYWWLSSTPTEVAQFYRVEIDVGLSEAQREQPLYTLVAFFSADLRSEQEQEPPGDGQQPDGEAGPGTQPQDQGVSSDGI
jgi:general secretion pathway protein I